MKHRFFYKIYGLSVISDIYIQQAYECEELTDADVEISYGKVPEFLRDAGRKGYGTWTNGFTDAWFQTPGAAQFYVQNGREIVVEPEEDGNVELICSMILSAGFSLILLQRNEPVLHGSAIEKDGQAFIVCGESGAGKSSITMELLKADVGFLADDTVRVHMVDGQAVAEPTYPQQKVCRDMALQNGLKLEKLRYIDEQRDKFALMRREQFVPHPVLLKRIVILKKSKDIQEVTSRVYRGKDYLDALVNNLYLADTYKRNVGVPVQMMQQFIMMAGQVEVYEVCRPSEGDSVGAVMEKLYQIFQFC